MEIIGTITAGVRILELVKGATRRHSPVYRVAYVCCGKEAELTLDQIKMRRAKGREMCVNCALKGRPSRAGKRWGPRDKRAEKDLLDYSYPRDVPDYGVTPPMWPVPPIVLEEMRRAALFGTQTEETHDGTTTEIRDSRITDRAPRPGASLHRLPAKALPGAADRGPGDNEGKRSLGAAA